MRYIEFNCALCSLNATTIREGSAETIREGSAETIREGSAETYDWVTPIQTKTTFYLPFQTMQFIQYKDMCKVMNTNGYQH